MKLENNILAICGNIIITKDHRAIPMFEFHGFPTSVEDENQQFHRFDQLKDVFSNTAADMHWIVVPMRQSLTDVRDQYTAEMTNNLQGVGVEHTGAIFDHLQASDELGESENKVKYYVGIELKDHGKETKRDRKGNASLREVVSDVKETMRHMIQRLRGRDDQRLTAALAERLIRASERMRKHVQGYALGLEPLSMEAMARVIPWTFTFGLTEKPVHHAWKESLTPIHNRHGEVVARVQQEEDVLRLHTVGVDNDDGDHHLVLKQVDANNRPKDTYISFLHMVNFPTEIHFPDNQWMDPIKYTDFPVGVSLKLTYVDGHKRLSRLRRKRDNLNDQVKHLSGFNEDAGENVHEGLDTAEKTINSVEKSREGSFKLSGMLVVHADTLDELEFRRKELIATYQKAPHYIDLQATYGLQLKSLMESLPGSPTYIHQFIQDLDFNGLTASFIGNQQELGDDYGAYQGRTSANVPVWLRPGRAAEATTLMQSLFKVYAGKTGNGKSMAANQDIYETVMYGGRVILLDPKSERTDLCHWDERLTELGDELTFITFSSRDEDAGKMDPFLIFEDRNDGREVAKEVINYLMNVSIREDVAKNTVIARALKRVSERKEPGIRFVKDELRWLADHDHRLSQTYQQEASDVANALEQFEDVGLSRLIFGEPMEGSTNRLDATKQLNVLQVSDLDLPEVDAAPEEYSEQNIVSVAILFSLTAYMTRFIRRYQDDLTAIAIDEAWNFLRNAAGERLLRKLSREGRAVNAPCILMTQNISDIPLSIRNQVGAVYCFGTDGDEELAAIKEIMNMQGSDYVSNLLPGLTAGWCLHKDLNKRVGVMQIRVLQDHLFDAFDTSQSKKQPAVTAEGGG